MNYQIEDFEEDHLLEYPKITHESYIQDVLHEGHTKYVVSTDKLKELELSVQELVDFLKAYWEEQFVTVESVSYKYKDGTYTIKLNF